MVWIMNGTGLVLALARELGDPAGLEVNVVGEPDVVRLVVRLRKAFSWATGGRSDRVALAPDWLGAPVTVEGATPRAGHVEAEIAMGRLPSGAVARHVDQLPRGEGEPVNLPLGLARRVPLRGPGSVRPPDQAADRPERTWTTAGQDSQ
jgi:hypothetical protein